MKSKGWRMRWLGGFALPAALLGPLLPSLATAQPQAASPTGSASPARAAGAVTPPAAEPAGRGSGDEAKKPQVRTYSSVTVVDDPKQVPPLPTGRKGDAGPRGAELKTGIKPQASGPGPEPPRPPAQERSGSGSDRADRPDRGDRGDRASQHEQLRQELRELRQELRESRGPRERDHDGDNRAAGPRLGTLKKEAAAPRLERLRERLRPSRE